MLLYKGYHNNYFLSLYLQILNQFIFIKLYINLNSYIAIIPKLPNTNNITPKIIL